MFKYSPIRMSPLRRSGVANWNITPATPTVTINSNTSLTIDWVITGLDKTVTAVELWRSTDDTTYTRLVKLGAVATYDHDGLENNSIHYYKVRYWSGVYVSGFSEVVSARTINYVDYIQSSGTQYIDSEIVPDLETEMGVSFLCTVIASGQGVAGVLETDKNCSLVMGTSLINQRFGDALIVRGGGYWSQDVLYTVIQNKIGQTVNSTLSTWGSTPSSFTASYNIYFHSTNQYDTKFIGRSYNAYIKNNGTYQGNYKPALNLSGQFCMFDEVSKTYKLNSGTGIFTGGGLTTAEIDAALIQYAAAGVESVTIDFRGTDNGYRSIASDAAVATLVAAGCTVYVNDIVSDSLAFFIDPSNTLSYPGTGTTVNDLSANGYDGTIQNNITLGELTNGSRYFAFAGDDNNINLGLTTPNLYAGTGDFTWQGWIKTSAYTGTYRTIFSGNAGGGAHGLGIGLHGTANRYYVEIRGSDGARQLKNTGEISAGLINAWQLLTVIVDKSELKVFVYINTTLFATLTYNEWTSIDQSSSSNLTIGSYSSAGTSQPYNGLLGANMVYRKALTDAEILQNYNVHAWRFA